MWGCKELKGRIFGCTRWLFSLSVLKIPMLLISFHIPVQPYVKCSNISVKILFSTQEMIRSDHIIFNAVLFYRLLGSVLMCSASCKIANKWQLELLILPSEVRKQILFIRQSSLSEKIGAITNQFPVLTGQFQRICLQRVQGSLWQAAPTAQMIPSLRSSRDQESWLQVLGHLTPVSPCPSALLF